MWKLKPYQAYLEARITVFIFNGLMLQSREMQYLI